jgi:hypothetical protein
MQNENISVPQGRGTNRLFYPWIVAFNRLLIVSDAVSFQKSAQRCDLERWRVDRCF